VCITNRENPNLFSSQKQTHQPDEQEQLPVHTMSVQQTINRPSYADAAVKIVIGMIATAAFIGVNFSSGEVRLEKECWSDRVYK
jgi:hypothetical protein